MGNSKGSKEVRKSVESTIFAVAPSAAIISTELKYALSFWAARETKRLKAEVGFEKNGHQCVRKELVVTYLRAQLIKKGILKDEHLVVAGRQERWTKAMEFGLGDADKVGFFVKGGGDWSTTAEFDAAESTMTEKKFMAEVLRRLQEMEISSEQDEKKKEEAFSDVLGRLGLTTVTFTEDLDDLRELLRIIKENGKIIVIME